MRSTSAGIQPAAGKGKGFREARSLRHQRLDLDAGHLGQLLGARGSESEKDAGNKDARMSLHIVLLIAVDEKPPKKTSGNLGVR